MNQQLKAKLDALCKEQAIKHSTSEKFINLCISVSILVQKLAVINMFSESKTINVSEAISATTQDTSTIILVGAALAGLEDAMKVQSIYIEVNTLVIPLLQVAYSEAPSKSAH